MSVISMLVVVGCSNPTNIPSPEETSQEEKPVENAPETPTQPEQPPATEQPPAPESQPENEDSDEEETQEEPEQEEETPQGGESEENTEQEEETPEEPEQGGESEEENEQEEPEEETPQVPEDKSPFEYVKPDCVNLADYTYVGDYIFADTMNFAEWKYSNAETEYRLAFEKVARVRNDNPDTRIIRFNYNDYETEISVIKATRYKIYVKTSVVENTTGNFVVTLTGKPPVDTYDGSYINIRKYSDGSFTVKGLWDPVDTLTNYVAY